MKIYFFIFLQFIFFSFSNCYIKIPLKFYPCQIFNVSNPSNTFNNMVMLHLYAKLELGSPKQTIFVPLEIEKNDFYITKYDKHYSNEKYVAFDLKNFNEEESSSFYYTKKDDDGIYYGTNFFTALISKDLFFFGEKKIELEFYLADILTEYIPGELGLQIEPIDDLNSAFDKDEKTFLKKIRNSGIINNYVWTIMYNNDNNDKNADAYLYIGDYLHNINSNDLTTKNTKFKEESLSSINSFIYQRTVIKSFEMNKLYLYKGSNQNDIVKDIDYGKNYLRVKLDDNLGGIQGSEIIRPYLEKNIFTEENRCHKDYFNYHNKFIFYYCDKNPSIKDKIKNNFLSLKFIHQDFNYNFTIDFDDVFVEKEDYYYFLIYFSDYYKYDWILGKPFLKKYNFMLDQDAKKILFYSEKEEVVLQGVQSTTLIILLIILIIIFLFLGFFFARKIYKTKFRKHMNFLDDNFDYSIEPEKNEIEMSKKMYE